MTKSLLFASSTDEVRDLYSFRLRFCAPPRCHSCVLCAWRGLHRRDPGAARPPHEEDAGPATKPQRQY